MRFFDCNCFIGLPSSAIARPMGSADELLARMDRAGIERALVWHVAQRDYGVPTGNRLLAEAVAGHADRLTGCWSIMPNQMGELPGPEEFCARMAESHVRALTAFPRPHGFMLRRDSCGPILEAATERRIPLILPVTSAVGWESTYTLLAELPDLVCILSNVNTWATVRFFLPLIERYAHVYLDISEYILDGGIEALSQRCGAGRMLFGTAFPSRPHGGMMLAIRHAEIPEKDKRAIAAGNLEQILAEACL
jgi:predicted TIM-barrel fold metal-dependent hydrolase